jgi:hypothetical protein
MDKTEEIKMYIEYMTSNWIKFYTLSKGVKNFKYDPSEELNKMYESMNNILNSIEFDTNISDVNIIQFIRDHKLNNILNNEKN